MNTVSNRSNAKAIPLEIAIYKTILLKLTKTATIVPNITRKKIVVMMIKM
jgi:hypothetical protein